MSDVHVHDLVGAYVVDAVDDLERAAFERHLAECPACRSELASLREAAFTLSTIEPVEPPARMREHVLAGIGSIRPLPPEVAPHVEREAAPSRRRFRPTALVAAAAAVIALGAGGVVWQQVADDGTPSQTPPSASPAERVMAAADAEEYTQHFDGVELTVVRSRSLNEAVLLAPDMPAAPSGKVYELWLDHGEGMVPAGIMTGGEDEVSFTGDPGTAVGAAITKEPAPDGSEAPTSETLTSFTFEKA